MFTAWPFSGCSLPVGKWLYGKAELSSPDSGGNAADYSCLGALLRVAFLELWMLEVVAYLGLIIANILRGMFLS